MGHHFNTGTRRWVQLYNGRSQFHIYLTPEALLLPFDNHCPHDGTGSALNIHIPGSHRLGRETLTRDIDSIGIFSLSAHRFRSHTPDITQCSSHRYALSNMSCLSTLLTVRVCFRVFLNSV